MAAGKARRWQVQPDHLAQITVDGELGEVPAVSKEAIAEAVMDAVVMQYRTGGIISCIVNRLPTGFPGEAITTGAVVEHRDGVRASVEAPVAPVQVQPVPEPQAETEGLQEAATAGEEPADGFDLSQLEEEDVSELEGANS